MILSFNQLRERVYDVCGFECSGLREEQESAEYQACSLSINRKNVLYRHAKITPTKNGQFVTVWKRPANKPISPFDSSDKVDLLVVTVQTKNQ